MRNTAKQKKRISAEAIAKQADKGQNISSHFTNKGKMMPPIQRVNLDLTQTMLQELDQRAVELNISRQAVIKTFVRQALDQHYFARSAHRAAESPDAMAGLIASLSDKRVRSRLPK